MKPLRYLYIAIFIFMAFVVKASPLENDMAKANAAYRAADYQKAVQLYERILKTAPSVEVYYNLGNSYYRIENIPMAILYYEKAVRLSPLNADIVHNIDIARSKTIDKLPPESEFFIVQWYKYMQSVLTIDAWANTALCALVISLLLFLAYLFMDNMFVRRCSFYFSLLSLFVFIFANICAWQRKSVLSSHDAAIVISGTASVKVSPTAKAAEAFLLHEGSKVHITDTDMEGWLGIRLSDGREGWIYKRNVKEI